MEGNFYVRKKSSLTGKRVKTDAAFARTMQYANLLGNASKIASAFYKTLSKKQKEKALYKKITGMTMQLLKEGKDEENIIMHLHDTIFPEPVKDDSVIIENKDAHRFADALLEVIFAKRVSFESATLKDYGFV